MTLVMTKKIFLTDEVVGGGVMVAFRDNLGLKRDEAGLRPQHVRASF